MSAQQNTITTTDQTITYVVYETTNNITNETYTGVFSYEEGTAKGEFKYNKYIGQGITYDGQAQKMKPTAFTQNVAAYGYDSFTRKDIHITNLEDEAYTLESIIANEKYVNNPLTLNQRTGGKRGKVGAASRKRRSVAVTGANNPNAKQVMNLETGNIYGSIKDAAKKLKIGYESLKYQLRNNKNPNIILL